MTSYFAKINKCELNIYISLGSRNCLPFQRTWVHPTVVSDVCVAQSLVSCVMFCRSSFVLCLLAIVLSVLLYFTSSDYLFGIFWPLYCLSSNLGLLMTSMVSFGHCIAYPLIYIFWWPLWYLLSIVLSVLWFTASDYLFGIFWPLYCLSSNLGLLITLVSSNFSCINSWRIHS